MRCWKQDCLEECTIFCKCSEAGIYSCLAHYLDHIKLNSEVKHDPEPLHLEPNPETKQVLCDFLRRKNTELNRFRSKIINKISKKIKQLKSQLIIAIEEIERVKNENLALMNRIILTEKASKNDSLGKFLILKPDVAMKSIQDEICRIDYEKILDYIECNCDYCDDYLIEGDEISIFRANTKKLVRYNLNDQTIKEVEIPIEQAQYTYCSICKIPNGNLICYGGCSPYNSTVFMIHPDNSIKYLASLAQPRGCSSTAIYYKKKVYAFGGYDKGYVLTPEKYNIAKNKWKQLPNLSAGANYCTGFGYKNKIFFAGYQHSKIYVYDIKQNTYSEIPIALNQGGKVLLLKKNTFYVIVANSNIYEFDANNYNEWRTVGSTTLMINKYPVSHIVEFKNCFYFMDHTYCLYKFDLNLKSVEEVKTI